MEFVFANRLNSTDPDEIPLYGVYLLDLHSLSLPLSAVSRPQRVKTYIENNIDAIHFRL